MPRGCIALMAVERHKRLYGMHAAFGRRVPSQVEYAALLAGVKPAQAAAFGLLQQASPLGDLGFQLGDCCLAKGNGLRQARGFLAMVLPQLNAHGICAHQGCFRSATPCKGIDLRKRNPGLRIRKRSMQIAVLQVYRPASAVSQPDGKNRLHA